MMPKFKLLFFMPFIFSHFLYSQQISVKNAKLMVGDKPVFINGVNTPWANWNDFGGNFYKPFWDTHFKKIKNAGGNATRIWITCSGEVGINIDDNGLVSGATEKHWKDLDELFGLARKNKIYILATLISFDHTKNTYSTYPKWRKMYTQNENVESFTVTYVIPFVNRYKSNPYLFAVEPCNEIEWVNQNDDNGRIPWDRLQYFCARVVNAVHKNSSILTTVGNNMKWQSDSYPGCEGNLFSDKNLKAQYDEKETYIDFYSPHFYDWVTQYFGNPMKDTPVSKYGLSDKPVIIGEMPANGVGGVSITDSFINGYKNGIQGIMPWTSNGVDSNGSLKTGLEDALSNFKSRYPSLVIDG
jgi:hypothetical protein